VLRNLFTSVVGEPAAQLRYTSRPTVGIDLPKKAAISVYEQPAAGIFEIRSLSNSVNWLFFAIVKIRDLFL
jgi:hypothetical protein